MSYHFKVEVEIPDWANWIAQDKDGDWYFYEKKPSLTNNAWVIDCSMLVVRAYLGKRPKDWTQEIYEIWR